MIPGILIAGIGNIFLGDDAFGCEVIRKLLTRQQPDCVRIFDFGIRGFELTYALLDVPATVILVDAVPRGETPGTVYLIEPELSSLDEADDEQNLVEMHGMEPVRVLPSALSVIVTGRPGLPPRPGCSKVHLPETSAAISANEATSKIVITKSIFLVIVSD